MNRYFVALFALVCCMPVAAFAASNGTPQVNFNHCIQTPVGSGVMSSAITEISGAVDGITSRATFYALGLFRLLITLEIGWFLIKAVSKRAGGTDIAGLLGDVGFKGLSALTFLAIIQWFGASGNIQHLFDGFATVATHIVQLPGGAVPIQAGLDHANSGVGGIMHLGSCVSGYVVDGAFQHLHLSILNLDLVSFALLIVDIFTAVLIGLAYYIIAAQLFLALLESSMLGSAGVFMLGFLGSRWTSQFAGGYIRFIFSTGIKIFVTFIIAAFGGFIATQLIANLNANFAPGAGAVTASFQFAFGLMGLAILLIFMAVRLPATAATLMTGAPDFGFGGMAATAAAVGGAAAAVAMGAGAAGGAIAAKTAGGSGVRAAAAITPSPAASVAAPPPPPSPPPSGGGSMGPPGGPRTPVPPGASLAGKLGKAGSQFSKAVSNAPHAHQHSAGPSIEIKHHDVE